MRVLFLAPEPFFQERGTPLAVRMLLEELGQSRGYEIDLLCYHEGQTITLPGVTIHRIAAPQFCHSIGPGVSLRKLWCDLLLVRAAHRLAEKARDAGRPYDFVQAVEEGVFIAWSLKARFKLPFVYDMDSSIAQQLTEKWRYLAPFNWLWRFLEGQAMQRSVQVIAVCPALAKIAENHGAKKTSILTDISLLTKSEGMSQTRELRTELKLGTTKTVALYIGNLEKYQGIDLLIDSACLAFSQCPHLVVVVVGGDEAAVTRYRQQAEARGVTGQLFFVGPRPVSDLGTLMKQADILLSPRIRGINTPMKIYSYLHSGVVVLATDLVTHNQVLTKDIAVLAAPDAENFAAALVALSSNPEQRRTIGTAAQLWADENCSRSSYQRRVATIYTEIEQDFVSEKKAAVAAQPQVRTTL